MGSSSHMSYIRLKHLAKYFLNTLWRASGARTQSCEFSISLLGPLWQNTPSWATQTEICLMVLEFRSPSSWGEQGLFFFLGLSGRICPMSLFWGFWWLAGNLGCVLTYRNITLTFAFFIWHSPCVESVPKFPHFTPPSIMMDEGWLQWLH